MNNFSGVGRITKELELRYSQAGKAVLNFTIAINRPFTNQNGDREADFINVVTFGKQAENLANFMSKGSQVGIEGRLQSRSYDNQEGRKIFVTEVVANNVTFLESKNKGTQDNNNQSNTNTPNNQQNNSQGTGNTIEGNGEPLDIDDSDLPF